MSDSDGKKKLSEAQNRNRKLKKEDRDSIGGGVEETTSPIELPGFSYHSRCSSENVSGVI